MCTAVVSVGAGTVLVAGVRDEFVDRAWQPPGRHWPEFPRLIGGRDLLAGGTWLAVDPAARRVACVLNARGRMAPPESRRSRGVLPLRAAAGDSLGRARLADFDPFHLVTAGPGWACLASWDGENLAERELPAGLHVIVNSGVAADLLAAAATGQPVAAATGQPVAAAPVADQLAANARAAEAKKHEIARVAYFLPRLAAVAPPVPLPGSPIAQAWAGWLPILNGDGIVPGDPRALLVRWDLGGGRVWGTTSISLVALSPGGVRYDFSAEPGDPVALYPVDLRAPRPSPGP